MKRFKFKTGGCGIYVSKIYFSNFLENKEEKKTEVTLSLILRFNLRLGGYSIWSASTSCTIYKQDFGAWAPHSLGATKITWKTTRSTQKHSMRYSEHWKHLKMPSKVLDACKTWLRRARGLIRPRAVGLLTGVECSRVRDSSWMYLTSFVTTWIDVG